jgi:hypothetical protein
MCFVCEGSWEEHDTVFEGAEERRAMGLATGNDFLPLSETPEIQEAVFGRIKKVVGGSTSSSRPPSSPESRFESGEISSAQYNALISAAPNQNASSDDYEVRMLARSSANLSLAPRNTGNVRPDRSIALSHVTSGGQRKGKVLNRYGKAEP